MTSPYLVAADAQDRSEEVTRILASAMHRAYDHFSELHRAGMALHLMTEDQRIDNSIALKFALDAYTAAKAAFEASVK